MKLNDLIGAWELIEFRIEDAQEKSRDWGKDLRGRLFYLDTGHMSVSILRDTPDPQPQDWEPLDDVLCYAGTFKLNPDGTLEHRVEIATDRTRVGQVLVRRAELNAGILHVSNKTASGETALLRWKRLG